VCCWVVKVNVINVISKQKKIPGLQFVICNRCVFPLHFSAYLCVFDVYCNVELECTHVLHV
jgi:hypothetical protein